MVTYVETKPKKYFHFRMRSWMWGFLFGCVWSISYLGAAGVFGPVPRQDSVDIVTKQLAIMPTNLFYTAVLRPTLRALIIPPSRPVFLYAGVGFILLVWSFVFLLLFPLSRLKFIALSAVILWYVFMVRVFEISPYICIECLQATAVEYDPGAFIRGK